ncbi:MAG TPA: type IV toxin-antitoxin system AbiEi family antitoxin domain-containing protein [Pseudomonadales bacterium]
MNLQNQAGVNRLSQLVPEGVAIPAQWLMTQGYSRQSLNQYKQRGYLQSPARGVYALPGMALSWQGVVLGLQRLASLPVHVGGLTALGLQGKAHYLPLAGEKWVHLWGSAKLPAWANRCGLQAQLLLHSRVLFAASESLGLVELPTRMRDWPLTVSGPERAMLECCAELDDSEASFTHAAELMDGLTTLRPTLLNDLLQHCQSVKAKRVFLCLAENSAYAWREKIDQNAVDLGAGKRQVVKGGRLDKTWQITVPKSFGRAFNAGLGGGFS